MGMKRAYAVSVLRQLLAWAAAVAVLGGLFFGMQAAVARSGEWVARFLAPPIYPGSVRVSYQRTELPGYVQEVSNYQTGDDVDQVVAYLSSHYVPAVAEDVFYTTWRPGYSLLNAADFIGLGPTVRPKASVAVQGIASRAVTNIRVILIWPVVMR
jgi:hypothetical protein